MRNLLNHSSLVAASLCLAAASHALAQTDGFPIEISSFPFAFGQGAVNGSFMGTSYSNQYLSLGLSFGTFNPATLTASVSGSGNTGGGIGFGQGQANINTNSSLISAFTINGSASCSASVPFTGPGEFAGGYGDVTAYMNFEVTSPIIAQWTSTGDSTLFLGGVPVSTSPNWIITLPAGLYKAQAHALGNVSIPANSSGAAFFTSSTFKLEVGVPAPSTAALLGIAGLVAGRRRR